LLAAVRTLFEYGPGEDRATGYLYGDGQPWPQALAELGHALLDDLEQLLAVRFEVVAFQAYRNGAGCPWHADTPFDAQAVLSLGATRTFGVRRTGDGRSSTMRGVADGDLVVMPSGFQTEWEHCVPVEEEPGERVALVFRTIVRS
jgi:alkylated DNA repair dioxygenase AlkB